MAVSPQMQAQYDANRLRMNRLNANFRKYMWGMLALGATIFCSSLFAGALSTLKANEEGPWIFYTAMSAGVYQVLLGLATILFGWMTSAKKRVPSFILLGIYALGMMMILFRQNGTFAAANIFFLLTGIGLNVWAQMLFNEDDALKEQPGYPLFSVEADVRAHYEVPLNVAARRAEASENMAAVGTPDAPVSAPPMPAPAAAPAAKEDGVFSNPKPLGPTPAVTLPPEVDISGLEVMQQRSGTVQTAQAPIPVPDVALETLTNQTAGQKEALPQLNAADMLADMRDIPSHATVQGNPDMLPTPEDVRARLAAMRKARSEHPQEGE